MSFSCPHLDLNRDWCLRLDKVCVPGRAGCVIKTACSPPAEERVRERAEEIRQRAVLASLTGAGHRGERAIRNVRQEPPVDTPCDP